MDENGNGMYIGRSFSSFEKLHEAISQWELEQNVKLFIRDSRTIACAHKKGLRTAIKPALKYSEILYCCNRGGKRFVRRGQHTRKTSIYRQECNCFIRFRVRSDGQTLYITSLYLNHNHPGPILQVHKPLVELDISDIELDDIAEVEIDEEAEVLPSVSENVDVLCEEAEIGKKKVLEEKINYRKKKILNGKKFRKILPALVSKIDIDTYIKDVDREEAKHTSEPISESCKTFSDKLEKECAPDSVPNNSLDSDIFNDVFKVHEDLKTFFESGWTVQLLKECVNMMLVKEPERSVTALCTINRLTGCFDIYFSGGKLNKDHTLFKELDKVKKIRTFDDFKTLLKIVQTWELESLILSTTSVFNSNTQFVIPPGTIMLAPPMNHFNNKVIEDIR